MTFENNMSFLLACENNNLQIVQYLHRNIPKIEFKNVDFIHRLFLYRYFDLIKWIHTAMPYMFDFITQNEMYEIFKDIIYVDTNIAFWMLSVFPNIPIYLQDNKLFINACNSNNIAVATLFAIMRPECYYVCVIDNEIVGYEILSILTIKNTRKTTPETCYICYDNTSNVVTSCNHQYCITCIERHYSVNNHLCPYCRTENWENDLSIIKCL